MFLPSTENIYGKQKFQTVRKLRVSKTYLKHKKSIRHSQVKEKLRNIQPASQPPPPPPGNIPPIVLNKYAGTFLKILTHIYNSSMKQGIWPTAWRRKKCVTLASRVFPPKLKSNLRNISGLVTLVKIKERLIADLIVSDMKDNIAASQYGNQKRLSIQHYLVKII